MNRNQKNIPKRNLNILLILKNQAIRKKIKKGNPKTKKFKM